MDEWKAVYIRCICAEIKIHLLIAHRQWWTMSSNIPCANKNIHIFLSPYSTIDQIHRNIHYVNVDKHSAGQVER